MAKRWTEEEDNYLLINYGKHDLKFLSSVLGKSEEAVDKHYKRIQNSDKETQIQPELEFFLSRSQRINPKKLKKKNIKGSVDKSKLSGWSGKGNPYAHTRSGFREDLGIVVRSGWEADVLRVLRSFEIEYEFEPKVFYFPVKRGNKAYTPDILLYTDEWVEVKGYLDKASAIKIKRFKKYYPEEFSKFTMIIGKSKQTIEFCEELNVPNVLFYPEIKRLFKDKIHNWESS